MLFSAYALASQAGLVARVFNPYYTAILSNGVMFGVCMVASYFFPGHKRDLSGLTFWDQGKEGSSSERHRDGLALSEQKG